MEFIPPSDLEAERMVIGHCMWGEAAILECMNEGLTPFHFYDPDYTLAYQAILDLHKKELPVHFISVSRVIEDDITNLDRLELQHLHESTPTTIGAEWAAKQVIQKAKEREVWMAAGRALTQTQRNIPLDDILRELQDGITKASHKAGGVFRVSDIDVSVELYDHLDNPTAIKGIPTGFDPLDWKIGGWRKTRLHMLAAGTSFGKSFFIQDRILSLAERGYSSILFSTEMDEEEITLRLVHMYAENDPVAALMRSVRGEVAYTQEEKSRIIESMKYIQRNEGIFLKTEDISLHGMRTAIEMNPFIDAVFLDHIDMLAGSPEKEGYQLLKEQTRELKNMAKKYQVPLIVVSHVNRPPKNKEGKEVQDMNLSRLLGSGTKEQDSNIIMFLEPWDDIDGKLTREQFQEIQSRGGISGIKLTVEKNRHGPSGYVMLEQDWGRGGRYYLRNRNSQSEF